jgi:hypothetical protein
MPPARSPRPEPQFGTYLGFVPLPGTCRTLFHSHAFRVRRGGARLRGGARVPVGSGLVMGRGRVKAEPESGLRIGR